MTSNDMPELKPCPFCGGAAYKHIVSIRCKGCDVRFRPPTADDDELITAWNTRTNLCAAPAVGANNYLADKIIKMTKDAEEYLEKGEFQAAAQFLLGGLDYCLMHVRAHNTPAPTDNAEALEDIFKHDPYSKEWAEAVYKHLPTIRSALLRGAGEKR
jgi:hypothetical protein